MANKRTNAPSPIVLKHGRKNKLSPRQIALVSNLIRNPDQTAKSLLVKSGYSPSTAEKAPAQILGTDRVVKTLQDSLRELHMDEKLRSKLDELLSLDVTRFGALILQAMQYASKIRGDFAPTKHQNASISVDLSLPGTKPKAEKKRNRKRCAHVSTGGRAHRTVHNS